MNLDRNIYVCPETGETLICQPEKIEGKNVISGWLVREDGKKYRIQEGVPDLVFPQELEMEQGATLDYYEEVANIYDDVADLSFRIQFVDEARARKAFVERLKLSPSSRVLELACGTGRDSINIANFLDEGGQLFLQDLSSSMLRQCVKKLSKTRVAVEFSTGNACYLPFPDNYFDAVFSFGGLGVFGDVRRSLREMVRVSKVGANVVVGDESMAPWLYETEYGRILLNNNPLFKNTLPLADLPVEARNVSLQWVVGGVYYLIEFEVGVGEPQADFDLEIPGKRGGSLRSRYYGKLEGVTPEAHKLAQKARDKSGKSMHQWLDEVVRDSANRELKK
jgi:ubiquinone/menaquinone biosynthesis C-methylase UbiE